MRKLALLTGLSALTAALAVASSSAGAQQQPEQPPAEAADDEDESLSPEDRARRSKVVARIGDARITVGDVEDAVNQQSPFLRVRYREPEQLRSFVDSLVRFELLARQAERDGYGDDPEVQRVVKQNAVQHLIRHDFDERITVEDVPADDVQEYYQSHQDEFTREEMRRASHIAVRTRAEAVRLIREARTADARAFRALVREHSQDPETRLRGGDLRYFTRSGTSPNARDPRVDEALTAAAFALNEVGDVAAEPVAVGDRFSVVKLTGRRPAEHRTLEQAAPTIRLRLWRAHRQRALEEFVTQLRERAGVRANYELLRPIQLDPPPRASGDPHGHGSGPASEPSGAAAETPAAEGSSSE